MFLDAAKWSKAGNQACKGSARQGVKQSLGLSHQPQEYLHSKFLPTTYLLIFPNAASLVCWSQHFLQADLSVIYCNRRARQPLVMRVGRKHLQSQIEETAPLSCQIQEASHRVNLASKAASPALPPMPPPSPIDSKARDVTSKEKKKPRAGQPEDPFWALSRKPLLALQETTGYAQYKDVPVQQIKKITAQRLLESKQTIPHYYLSVNCRVDKLIALRQELNQALAAGQGWKLSVNDFVIKAAALVSSSFGGSLASDQ